MTRRPTPEQLIDISQLINDYADLQPDPTDPAQRVSFGTSGHRGTSSAKTFNQKHIIAITAAVVEYRQAHGVTGALYIGYDTHALSECAFQTALRVLVAAGVQVRAQPGSFTPTPLVSHAILVHNRTNSSVADGIIITPSHNPPQDGGFKYNPPTGGPASTDVTRQIEARANEILSKNEEIPLVSLEESLCSLETFDFIETYISNLEDIIEMKSIAEKGVTIGVDPLGGSSLEVWKAIRDRYGLSITILNDKIDPQFSFMPLDKDGVIRMDCSSPYVMSDLLQYKDGYDVCIGNDPDADRHGIVTSDGLMNSNHYLAVMIDYLFQTRIWNKQVGIGKTLVSSLFIDKLAEKLDRPLTEVPVGFKYFVDGLLNGTLGFAGEESAGASFLDKQGRPWSTDKDGIIAGLLAAEIKALTGKTPSQYYRDCYKEILGDALLVYGRQDAPAHAEEKAILRSLSPQQVKTNTLAGDPILSIETHTKDKEAVGGIKVSTEWAWFAARPSGTEDLYKIYAESLKGKDHLNEIFSEAKALVAQVLSSHDNQNHDE